MTSRERVHAALARQPVDRVPVFMWFQPGTAQRLAEDLDIPVTGVDEAMGNDVRQTWVNNNYAMEGIVHAHDGEGHTDYWGIEWVKDGAFNQIVHCPLQDADPDQVRSYRFPEPRVEDLLAVMKPVLAASEGYFLGCDVSPCVFEMVMRLRGMENAIIDLAADPGLSGWLLERSADFAVTLAEAACERFPLDWLWTGDDVGGQQSLIMSPACWREQIKPHLARVTAVGKRHAKYVAYHSCGAIRPIIADLIEIGVDVLNPIQCNCPGMDPAELKQEFGKTLAFMGGVDTQELLPRGSVADVRRATARLLETMTADGGGYILAASHTVPPETPLENIFAMYAEAGQPRELILDRAAGIRERARQTR
jgi:uroporphyrinogen decarboxylase